MEKPTPVADEIIEEVRAARREHAATHGFDLRRIYDDLKRKEQASGEPIVSFPPRKARERRRASGR